MKQIASWMIADLKAMPDFMPHNLHGSSL